MTDLDKIRARLEAIRGRVEGATPGKWEANESAVRHKHGLFYWSLSDLGGEEHNAAFIAHARADVPWLLDELQALREANTRLLSAGRAVVRDMGAWRIAYPHISSKSLDALAALIAEVDGAGRE